MKIRLPRIFAKKPTEIGYGHPAIPGHHRACWQITPTMVACFCRIYNYHSEEK